MVRGTEGSYSFFSPEMCRSPYKGHDGRKADVWALGVTTWAFFYGSVPFMKNDLMPLLESIAEADYTLPDSSSINESGQTFLRRLLTVEADVRPLPEELLEDKWFRARPKSTSSVSLRS